MHTPLGQIYIIITNFDDFGGLKSAFLVSKATMMKFCARVRTWYSLPTHNFIKKMFKGIRPLGAIFFTKNRNFRDVVQLQPHFYFENWLQRTDLENIRNTSTAQNFVRIC